MTTLQGSVDGRWSPVIDAFEEGFQAGREMGASLCVIHEGHTVIDVWAGQRDRRGSEDWQQDTLVCCFSISKAVTALCLLQAVDRGLLNLDEKVTTIWPEYGAADKGATSVRQLFCHQAGLPGLHAPVERTLFFDWDASCTALAAESPWWEPGTRHGYHARTFGFLLGEVLRRATGVTIDEWLRSEIAGPLGADFHFGLDAAAQTRCGEMIPAKVSAGPRELPPAMQRMIKDFTNPQTPTGAAFQNPVMRPGYMNKEDFRQAVIPAVNGHGNARSVATILAGIPKLVSNDMLTEAVRTQAHGPDEVLKSTTRFGLGLMLYEEESPIGWPGCVGHAGAGGSIGFYDPVSDTAFAFVMNQMQEGVVTGGTTATACIAALHEALA